jgi:hypothetical protein
MKLSLKPFFIQLGIFSVFTIGILLLWQQFAAPRFQTNLAWGIWFFFVVSTAFIHIKLMSVAETPKKFIYYFMGLTGIKLFTYLMIILIVAILKREAALGFTLFFLCMYFLYTGLEVFTLLKHFKK